MDYELAAKFCELSHDATVRNNAKLVQIFIMTGKVPREPVAALLKVGPRNGTGRLGYLRKAWMVEKIGENQGTISQKHLGGKMAPTGIVYTEKSF